MYTAWFCRIRRRLDMPGLRIGVLLSVAILAGCYYYGPPPGPYPYYYGQGTYDRSWNAALDAMRDTGVNIVSTDYNGGIIQGTRSGVEATIRIQGQADGRVRVEFHTRGPSGPDAPLSNQLYSAYERRMGR